MKAPQKIKDNYFARACGPDERKYLEQLRNEIRLTKADRALVSQLLAEAPNYENRTRIWDIAKHRLRAAAHHMAMRRHALLDDDQWYVAYCVSQDYREWEIEEAVLKCNRSVQTIRSEIRKKIADDTGNKKVRNAHIVRWFLGD